MAQLTGVWAEQATAVTGPSSPSSISSSAFPQKAAPPPQGTAVTTAAEQVRSSVDALETAAGQIETYLKSTGRELEIRVDEETGRTVVSVRDTETGTLIRQIPSEEVLRLARALGTQPNVLLDLLA